MSPDSQLVHLNDHIDTLKEAITYHELKKCVYSKGMKCGCAPYRKTLKYAQDRRDTIERRIDLDVDSAVENHALHGEIN